MYGNHCNNVDKVKCLLQDLKDLLSPPPLHTINFENSAYVVNVVSQTRQPYILYVTVQLVDGTG